MQSAEFIHSICILNYLFSTIIHISFLKVKYLNGLPSYVIKKSCLNVNKIGSHLNKQRHGREW